MYSTELFQPLCADEIVWIKTRTGKAQALFYNDSRHIGSLAFHETLPPIQLRLSGWGDIDGYRDMWFGMVRQYWPKHVMKSGRLLSLISNFVTKNVSMKVNKIIYTETNDKWSIDNIKNELDITDIDITITPDDKSNKTITVNMKNLYQFLGSISFESDYENNGTINDLNRYTTLKLKGRRSPFNAELPPNNLHNKWLKSSPIDEHYFRKGGKRRSHRKKSRRTRRRTHRKN
jgi:hypothetical protein